MTPPVASLTEQMRRKRVSQAELARRTGIHPTTISEIACGKVDPRASTLTRLFTALAPMPPVVDTCDVCGIVDKGAARVIRFSLTRKSGRRGAGGIYLCEMCWRRIGRPRMRKRIAA
jgi:transcriptional regulator with XRE-family HTH domain